jgi:UDP-N-acetyl-D-glucosamine dehydrogenase
VRRDRFHEVKFVELAHTVNAEMPKVMADRVAELLNDNGKAVRGSKILAIGAAYKGGTEDTRGSAALRVMSLLAQRGANVSFHDPLVPEVEVRENTLRSSKLSAKALQGADVVVALVPQVEVDWDLVAREAALVLDCCNALGRRGSNVVRF